MGCSGIIIIFLKAAIFSAIYIKETSCTLEHSSMLDNFPLVGGTPRMLCAFTLGILMSRIFKPINNVRITWAKTKMFIVR